MLFELILNMFFFFTLNPNSPGFSGSKSYTAVAQGCGREPLRAFFKLIVLEI